MERGSEVEEGVSQRMERLIKVINLKVIYNQGEGGGDREAVREGEWASRSEREVGVG